MSNRERCIAILDSLDESQLANIANILQAAVDAINEASDDAFCHKLYKDYQNDPDKEQFISLEQAARMLEVNL